MTLTGRSHVVRPKTRKFHADLEKNDNIESLSPSHVIFRIPWPMVTKIYFAVHIFY